MANIGWINFGEPFIRSMLYIFLVCGKCWLESLWLNSGCAAYEIIYAHIYIILGWAAFALCDSSLFICIAVFAQILQVMFFL
jgi:hypothetical protein